MDYLRERRGRQKLHPGVIVSSQDREHLPHGNEAIQWKWTSDASIGPEGNLTRCVPLPRLPLPLEKSPDAEGNCCLFWRMQLGLKEGFTVFQNTANTLKQLFGSGQVILGVSKPQLFNFKMDRVKVLFHCCWVMSVMSNSVRPPRRQPTRLPSLGFSRQEYWSALPFPSPMHESEKRK